MTMKISLKRAFDDAEKKWRFLSTYDYENMSTYGMMSTLGAEIEMKYPELKRYDSNCSFCSKFVPSSSNKCNGCVLVHDDGITCFHEGSIFIDWLHAFNSDDRDSGLIRLKAADMLNYIRQRRNEVIPEKRKRKR